MTPKPLEVVCVPATLAAPVSGAWRVKLDDSACAAMTDFTERNLVTAEEGMCIDDAVELMRHAGVRSAFAVDARGKIVGLITAYDLLGEKPMRLASAIECSRADIVVSDLMDPVEAWLAVQWEDVEQATVASMLASFARTDRTHLAVVEKDESGGLRLRGLFSRAKLERLTKPDPAA